MHVWIKLKNVKEEGGSTKSDSGLLKEKCHNFVKYFHKFKKNFKVSLKILKLKASSVS